MEEEEAPGRKVAAAAAATAPGFRFYPTEEELVSFYLHHKLQLHHHNYDMEIARRIDRIIPVLDIYLHNPWDLPKLAAAMDRDPAAAAGTEEEWFFFMRMQEREGRGGRPKRVAGCGYWKATGSLGYVYDGQRRSCIGEKRTMVFYKGKAPRGRKTHWKINEYKAFSSSSRSSSSTNDDDHLRLQQQQQFLQFGSSSSAAPPPPPPNLTLRHEYSLIRLYKKTKCVRSFDRRPLIPTSTTTPPHINQLINVTSPPHQADHEYPPPPPAVASSTEDRSPFLVEDPASRMSLDHSHHHDETSALWGCLRELDLYFNGDDVLNDL